jgi:hypothetical protein
MTRWFGSRHDFFITIHELTWKHGYPWLYNEPLNFNYLKIK